MAVIHGTEVDDTIEGTADADILRGFAGNDTIAGGDGDDTIDGDVGDDFLLGGTGTDDIAGGAGNDRIESGTGGYRYLDPVTGRLVTVYETVDAGDGDDTLTVSGQQDGRYVQAYGGLGADTLIVDHAPDQFFASGYIGFERLVVQSALNISYASNFQSITITDASINFANSFNPSVDLALHNQFLSMAFSTFRSVTGDSGNENLWLGQGSTIADAVDLGAGNDRLVLDHYWPGPGPALGPANGGAGSDRLDVWVATNATLSLDFTNFTSFETFGVNSEYGDRHSTLIAEHLAGVTFINVGWVSSIVLDHSHLFGALLMGAYGGSVTLRSDAVIGRYGMPADGPWDRSTDLATANPALSTSFVNGGMVEGNIAFYTGNDSYDGRSGTVGGTIFGNAGDDIILAGLGHDRLQGGYGADQLSGGAGNDRLTGGAGGDQLTGGDGNDLFIDTLSALNGDSILDFSRGDRIVFSDAALPGFQFQLSGGVLTYSGGSLTLPGLHNASLAVSQAQEGGVEITFAGPPLIVSAYAVPAAEAFI